MYERLGLDEEKVRIIDTELTKLTVPVRPGRNLSVIIEVAAMDYRLKRLVSMLHKSFQTRLINVIGQNIESKRIERGKIDTMVDLLAINPIAFQIGSLPVRWYGILIALGIVLAFIVVQREMVKRGMHPDFLTDLLIWAVPIAIISARIYYVIFSWDYYKDNPGQIFQIWEGGIAIHGALIGAFITTYVFTKRRGVSFWKVVDIAASGLLIGQIIGRWGNFMNQEAHGGPVSENFLKRQ